MSVSENNEFGDFDAYTWGVVPKELAELENNVRRIGERFGVTEDMYAEIEVDAIERANVIVSKVSIENFTHIVCKAKLEALVHFICEKNDLCLNDFTIRPWRIYAPVIYKGEEL